MSPKNPRLTRLFAFLQEHRELNETFQQQEYRRALSHCPDSLSRLTQLLHSTVNTQSTPRMSKLGQFWRELHDFVPGRTPSLFDLIEHFERRANLKARGAGPWERLFWALSSQPGWGPKTSALFVKGAIEVHRGPRALHFLDNPETALTLEPNDKVYLPVDAVITHVFKALGLTSPSFHSVNSALHESYDAEQMLVWDDLWFWGFFTQVSDGSTRRFEWNQDKFWCQISAPKPAEANVRKLGEEFIRLCRGARSAS